MTVIRVIKDLPIDAVVQIQLHPSCGQSVKADLVHLSISSVDFDGLNSNGGIDIWCAVVPDLHDDFIMQLMPFIVYHRVMQTLHVCRRVVTVITIMTLITILL